MVSRNDEQRERLAETIEEARRLRRRAQQIRGGLGPIVAWHLKTRTVTRQAVEAATELIVACKERIDPDKA